MESTMWVRMIAKLCRDMSPANPDYNVREAECTVEDEFNQQAREIINDISHAQVMRDLRTRLYEHEYRNCHEW